MRSTKVWLRLVGVALTLVAVAGVVIYGTAPPAALGWFAYAPLADEVTLPASPALSPQQLAGAVLAALGLAGAAGTVGYLLGRRSPAGRPQQLSTPAR